MITLFLRRGFVSSQHLGRRSISSWAENVANPKYKVQTYLSTTSDPFLNLSIEQYLLERSPADSSILFLYINRPCIVIGRNQNPWLEVNLKLLRAAFAGQQRNSHNEPPQTEPANLGKVDLVRRRSGGGAVFHDEGNVNWCIICPSSIFTRDKHAEMIVRALRKHGVDRARVNERHDIVLDQGLKQVEASAAADLHRTPYTVEPTMDGEVFPRPVKVSGSAYKLTKGRALHHGTCLLSTPNLNVIPHYLHSPARGYINAKGVESVSSPVANIGLDTTSFCHGVKQGFEELYAGSSGIDVDVKLGERALQVERVRSMYDEMQTMEWTYGQTPQFSFSTQPIEGSTRKAVQSTPEFPGSDHLMLDFKHGQLLEAKQVGSTDSDDVDFTESLKRIVQDRKLYDPEWNWVDIVKHLKQGRSDGNVTKQVNWLQAMLPSSHRA